MLRLLNVFLVNLGQTIYIVVVALDTEVLGQIDNLHVCGDGMFLKESLALAVAEAEEHYIYLVEWHLVSKPQISLADEAFVYVAYQVSCVTLAIGKDNLCLRVIQQHTDEFTTRIACRT